MSISWNAALEIGVEKVDEQHKQLFVALNDLIEAINNGHAMEKVNSLLGFLGGYVVQHFSDEEEIMRDAGYPDLESHQKIHSDFVVYFGKISDRIENDGLNDELVIEIKKKLFDWLWNHIGKVDRKLGLFIKNKETG